MTKKVWITLYSQTGSEIQTLSTALGIRPTIILTNTDKPLFEVFKHAKHSELMEWLEKSYPDEEYRDNNVLITLHGYLRIIPPEICARYKNMYNGHPGFISKYPELKGKDPQIRTWQDNEKYPIIGSVVHKVTPGVDEGEVVSSTAVVNRCESLDDMFNTLKMTSFDSWYFFLKRELCV
jgi:folate-dependent phosphoribosylglycinamide formyltransferase PurN